MKTLRLVLIGLVAMLACQVSAQKIVKGNLKFLKGETMLHCEFDYSETSMLGYSKAEFDEWKETLGQDSSYYAKRFFNGIIDELGRRFLVIGNYPRAKYQMIVHVLQIADNGDINAVCEFSLMGETDPLCTMLLKGSGGHIGSILSLIGDGMNDMGENLGDVLRKKTRGKAKK